ncbi:Bcr/CflA family multidrug efflux MFS transporter [Actinobacillus equuli subsp. equuli]|uniref:Bcr/CflA family multidrug efflux MFS transporter n=1 Tax=Actinobacillus equuli TaxID=718 RepID=UPI0024411BAD|nr:Bcr/CflA family multidrug efflux MFS transporter [Actinobacillus equuli]WGE47032.1 Bcr/CflA family multidrug efflux MFS transporter [Actinobacillus equuli subsp. haemolyticus]WGE49145.1 Bcr/CflA family multidrug efflux MFS transporter [Actinobacillus equuli subsp. equuli]WGE53392.1 Bcr/CflA family multidrug efflux MFS transporter [Actinobacillus equuli subsp. haemolyticus]WGE55522.1 Bcr/CflA family multidrug efflux MFS transporter [Actinobacillus equuli subsp. equuli]WGE73827.1 Bcr/CflA fam
MATQRPHPCFFIILGMMAMLPPLAIDMYLPSFLDIARDLQVSQEKVQTTLAVFTFGFAVGQLFWGPMADSFGRKPIILFGLAGSAIAAYFLTAVMTIENFYLLRLIQGLCAAAPAVVLGALVRDLFDRNRFAQMMSVIMIISMLAPLLAPILGGYIAKYFHWHSIFYTLVFMGVSCVFLISWKIPETLAVEKRQSLQFGIVFKNFWKLLSDKNVLGYVLVGGLTFAGLFCFLTSGSLVYIGIHGVSQEYFGYFFGLNMIVMVAMTALNGRIVVKVGSEKMLKIGLLVQLLAGIWLACVAVFQLGFWAMALGIPFYVGMLSTIGSNATAAILDRYPQMAGTANGLAGTARFGIASVVGAMLSHIAVTSERPMLYAMAICTLAASAIYYLLCRNSTEQAV